MPNFSPTENLSRAGVSIWLDDLSRNHLDSGRLLELVTSRNVVGVTTNPTIFAAALSNGDAYREQVTELATTDPGVEDVARACDQLTDLYTATGGFDGRVSNEVAPDLAHDTEATIAQARHLAHKVARPNVMVKIPATVEGLPAISAVVAEGISVNVTLIFSLERYRAVIDAYLKGLEHAQASGIDLVTIHSVASFFVSRVDAEIDKRLDTVGTREATAIRGRAAVANARLAYQVFERAFATDRARNLLEAGANIQRPLWASTGVKNPDLPPTFYVDELVAPHTVNTMPSATLEAVYNHDHPHGNTITGSYIEAQAVMDAVSSAGVSYDDVTAALEADGVAKFIASWHELLNTVGAALNAARDMAVPRSASNAAHQAVGPTRGR